MGDECWIDSELAEEMRGHDEECEREKKRRKGRWEEHTMMYFEGAGFPFPTKIASLLGYLFSGLTSGDMVPALTDVNKELSSTEAMMVTCSRRGRRNEQERELWR